jgi:hypothetical protein
MPLAALAALDHPRRRWPYDPYDSRNEKFVYAPASV